MENVAAGNMGVGVGGRGEPLLLSSHLTMFVFNSLFNNVTGKKLCEKNKVLRVYLFIHSFISVE